MSNNKIRKIEDYKKEKGYSSSAIESDEYTKSSIGEFYFIEEISAEQKESNEDNEMSKDMENVILNELRDLRAENKITNSRIDNTNKIIAIVGGLIGLVLTVFIFASNSQYNAIKDISNANMNSVETKMESINQKLDVIQQNNSMQIQRDVAQEILKYKK